MAQTTIASASKVILDLTDSGRLFVTITANHLRTQVKAKGSNGNPTLTPDWSSTPLVLTPVVYFDQQNIPIVNSKLSISWKKRVQQANGAEVVTNLGSDETVNSKVLTVNQNTLSNATNGMIAYQAAVTYTVAGVTYTETAEMEFTQVTDGQDGKDGESIASITNYYLASASASGVTTSTSGWQTTVQAMTAAKPYLWNYEVVTGSKGTTLNTTTPCIIGRYGKDGKNGDPGAAGRGIASITEHYQVSASPSTAPTTWSDTLVNTTTTNKYLWNYETITYTDGTSEDSTKRVIGTHGETGKDGDPGKDGEPGEAGRGVTATYTQYHVYSSKDDPPDVSSAGWSSEMPAWQRGVYLWLRTATEYTDDTTEYSTPTCDATWETVLDAVADIDVLKGQWAKQNTDGNRVVTTDDLLEGYAINLFIQKDIPQFTQPGSGYPSLANVRPLHPYQGFTVHQTGSTVLPALETITATKASAQTIELPYAIPAGSYTLSAVFGKKQYVTTVELLTTVDGSYVSIENTPSISSAEPTKVVIVRSAVTALRVTVASGASSSYSCAVTNIRMVPVGCEDDGRDPRHREMFVSIPEVVGGGVLNTEYQNIQADWIILPDLWKYTAQFSWSSTHHGGGNGGAPYKTTETQSSSSSSSGGSSSSSSSSNSGEVVEETEEEVVVETGEDIEIGGGDVDIGGGSDFVGWETVKLNREAFDALWTANLSEAQMPAEKSASYYFDSDTLAPKLDGFDIQSSHLQPTIYGDAYGSGGYYSSSVKDKIVVVGKRADDDGFFAIRPGSWTETYNCRDWVKACSETSTPIQVAIRPASPVNVYAGRTPKLFSFRGYNNIWIEGGAISLRLAGGSDIASITEAIAKLQERQDAVREAQLTLEQDVAKLQTKTASVEYGEEVWTTTTVGLQPGEFDTTIAAFTEATGVVEQSMTLDMEGLKLHATDTPYYTIITNDGFQVRKGFAKAEGATQYTDPDDNNLPASAYYNEKGELVETNEGQAQYTVKASFRADGAYIPQARITDVLSMGRGVFGWYDVAVVGGGLGFVWRDGTSGYILVQPTDCQVSAVGNAVRFRVTAVNIVEFQWKISTSVDGNGFPVWTDVADASAKTASLAYVPDDAHYNGNARWRCEMKDKNENTLYTNMCIATVR